MPLESLSPSGAERSLDWRGWRAKVAFDLPAGLEAENLRLVLSATPGDNEPAPHASIAVRLNNSDPAVLRPEPYPFNAQVDFPARYLRSGRNVAEIAFVSPGGECPRPGDGEWILDLAVSQAELTTAPPQIAALGPFDAWLRSEFLSPETVYLASEDMTGDARAAFEAWTAIAIGVRAPTAPQFTFAEPTASELIVEYEPSEGDEAWFEFKSGPSVTLEIHAPNPAAAADHMRAYAMSGGQQQDFAAPVFENSWSPEPASSVFVLNGKPARAALRLELDGADAVAPDSRLRLTLNGRPLHDMPVTEAASASVTLPAGLLVPGRNRIGFAPDLAPVTDTEFCPPTGGPSPISFKRLRIDREGMSDQLDLFAFAAGDFGAGAHLVLPPVEADDRAARLRLLAELARRAGAAPGIAAVTAAAPEHGANRIILAPRGAIPTALLAAAPSSFAAALRGDTVREILPSGSSAVAAGLDLPTIGGVAARFDIGGDPLEWITLVTEAADGDFAASLDHLADSHALDGFDGRVMRWTRDEVTVQDRGPFRAPPLQAIPPPTRPEMWRTVLFLCVLAGLSLGWALARGRHNRRR